MKMNYFVAGTNDMEAAVEFYGALFAQSADQTMVIGDWLMVAPPFPSAVSHSSY